MHSGRCGKNLTWELDGGTLTISGTGKMDDYFDDADIEWHPFRESIKKIIIADGVATIGDFAFYDCKNLTNVTIGNSVTTIGDFAFRHCDNLTSVTIPDSVTKIGRSAFSKCKSLTSVTILDSVTKIGNFAFCFCESLISVTIPDSVKSIGIRAFCNCSSLTNVTIPASVKTVGSGAFYGCTALKKIFYPAGADFDWKLSAGNNAKLIPYEELTWNFESKTLTVGDLREIKNYPYAEIPWVDHLREIQKIVVMNSVKKISAHAFDECTRLEQIEIPASVTTIGDEAFTVCYCGDRMANGGKNVFWCLEDGVLLIKKNPDVKSDANFSMGAVSWIFAEKNITAVKIERGIVPNQKFFEWLNQRGDNLPVSF